MLFTRLYQLPTREREEVFRTPHSGDFIIGCTIQHEHLTLFLGNLTMVKVPLAKLAKWLSIDVKRIKKAVPIDYGQTVKIVGQEVSSDAILYEFSPEYQSRIKQRLHQLRKQY